MVTLAMKARAPLAREAKREQDQAVEIPGFQDWKTGDNREARTDRQRFRALAELQADEANIWVHDMF
jgi:hypothetical protein